MRAIMALLSAGDRGKPPDLCTPPGTPGCGGLDARAGEWCQTPPGHEALSRLGAALGGRRRVRGRGTGPVPRG